MDVVEIGAKIGIYYIPFLFALCFHEYSHGLMARFLGDDTAHRMGRLTMNPLSHIDVIGTFILPIASIVFALPIFFGWAKPVPYDTRNLKNPRTGAFWIALAGPVSNLFLAVVAAVMIGILARYFAIESWMKSLLDLLSVFIMTNLFLAFFNLIPLHPLDGGKVIARFLPAHINYKLEQNEGATSMILMLLIFSGMLSFLRYPVMWTHQALISLALGGL